MQPKASDAEIIAALTAHRGRRVDAAQTLGIALRTLQSRITGLKSKGVGVPESDYYPAAGKAHSGEPLPRPQPQELEFPRLPSGKIDIRELIDRRKREFDRKDEAVQARKLIPIKVKTDQPIAVCLMGDPHVDDPGTDLAALDRECEVIKATPGMYAGCVGDLQNLWIGRLARLYAEQETTANQSWQLVEWFVNNLSGKWLFMVSGNHDHWAGSGDPLRWIQRQAAVEMTGDHTVRLALRFANGAEVRIVARHDFPGNSMWNPSHGQLRAAHLTHHDHVLVSGHKHTGGYQLIRVPATGLLAHCVQLGAYKRHDVYADTLGLPPRMISPSATVIIDPKASDLGIVRIEHDIEAAADWLTWRRKRG
jgi:hypothetical protein